MKKYSLVNNIRWSLWITVIVVLLLTSFLANEAWDGTKKLEFSIQSEEAIRMLHELESHMHTLRVDELSYFVYIRDPAQRNLILGDWSSNENDIEDTLKEISAHHLPYLSDAEVDQFSNVKTGVMAYAKSFRNMVSNTQNSTTTITLSDVQKMETRLNVGREHIQRAIETVEEIIERKVRESQDSSRALERELLVSAIVSGVLGVLTVALLLFSSIFIPVKLSRNIAWLNEVLESVSLGKQQTKISDEGVVKEFMPVVESTERLRISVNGMLDRIMNTDA